MTTDTAVRVTRTVIQQKGNMIRNLHARFGVLTRFVVALNDIPYIDYPELRIDEHESTEMPFRYIKNSDGTPIMPTVSDTKSGSGATKKDRGM